MSIASIMATAGITAVMALFPAPLHINYCGNCDDFYFDKCENTTECMICGEETDCSGLCMDCWKNTDCAYHHGPIYPETMVTNENGIHYCESCWEALMKLRNQ